MRHILEWHSWQAHSSEETRFVVADVAPGSLVASVLVPPFDFVTSSSAKFFSPCLVLLRPKMQF